MFDRVPFDTFDGVEWSCRGNLGLKVLDKVIWFLT